MNPQLARLNKLANIAASKARQPGDRSPASGAGFVSESHTLPQLDTRQGENGESINPLMWGMGNWGEADWAGK